MSSPIGHPVPRPNVFFNFAVKSCKSTFMRRSFVFVISLSLMMLASQAQQVFHKAGEIDLQLGVSAAMGNQRDPVYMFTGSPVLLARVTPKLSLGIGTELIATTGIGLNYYKNMRYAMPVFLDMKYDFRNMPKDKPVCPFIEMRAGYMLPFWMHKESDAQNIEGYYSTIAVGCSAYHSNVSLGLMMYDYSNPTASRRAIESSFFLRYAYNIRLSNRLTHEPQERVREPEQVENGDMRLHLYGGTGLLDPIVCLGFHEAPFHLATGAMMEYRFNRWLSVGLGTDVHLSKGGYAGGMIFFPQYRFNGMTASLPVYGDVRFTIGKRYVRPFFDLRCGYAIPLNTIATSSGHYHGLFSSYYEGKVKTGYLYYSCAFGLSFGPSEISTGYSVMGVRGHETNVETETSRSIECQMANFYLRYAYKFKIK